MVKRDFFFLSFFLVFHYTIHDIEVRASVIKGCYGYEFSQLDV